MSHTTSSCARRKANMYNPSLCLCINNNCLHKTIRHYSCGGNTCSSNIKSICDDSDCQNVSISKSQVSANSC